MKFLIKQFFKNFFTTKRYRDFKTSYVSRKRKLKKSFLKLKTLDIHVKRSDFEELDLYALNSYQLKNLVDKNVYFGFFQLEDSSYPLNDKTNQLLKNLQRKEEEDLDSLEIQDLSQPFVLICNKGEISKKNSKKLRDKGFINSYFVQGGLEMLLKEED